MHQSVCPTEFLQPIINNQSIWKTNVAWIEEYFPVRSIHIWSFNTRITTFPITPVDSPFTKKQHVYKFLLFPAWFSKNTLQSQTYTHQKQRQLPRLEKLYSDQIPSIEIDISLTTLSLKTVVLNRYHSAKISRKAWILEPDISDEDTIVRCEA